MTTIVYRDGTMAADSQVTVDDYRFAQARKIRKLPNGALFGFCGSLTGGYKMAQLLDETKGEITDALLKECHGASGLYVKPDGSMWLLEGGKRGGTAPLEGPFFADGSGFIPALAALKAGASAQQAVSIACEIDTGSSPPVIWETLGKSRKRR